MLSQLKTWWRSWSTGGFSAGSGQQISTPTEPVFDRLLPVSTIKALQISTIYACVELYANTIASLPIFVYEKKNGERVEARRSKLWFLLHSRPNAYMSPSDLKHVIVCNFLLTGNAYIEIIRGANREPVALVPLASEQVTVAEVDGHVYYKYEKDGASREIPSEDVIHWKGMGNGIVGLSKLDYMRATVTESINAQMNAARLYGARSKPSGVLQTEHTLDNKQVNDILMRFRSLAENNGSLTVVDRGLKYTPLSLTPADAQLLETRKFVVEEACRWFGVPPVLVGGSGATTWGSGIEQITRGWHTLELAPKVNSLQEAMELKLVPVGEDITIEFNFDALLRATPQERAAHEATMVQNGIMTRNEVRHLENLPPVEGGDELTVQSNLLPIDALHKVGSTNLQGSNDGSTIKQ